MSVIQPFLGRVFCFVGRVVLVGHRLGFQL
jgi:hypothetical protein